MQFAVADAKLGTQAVAESIGKTGGGIMKNAGSVHFIHELFSVGRVLRQDAVRMARTILINVLNRFNQTFYYLDGNFQVAVFGVPVFLCSVDDWRVAAYLRCASATSDLYSSGLQSLN